jgi:hypothetical protein
MIRPIDRKDDKNSVGGATVVRRDGRGSALPAHALPRYREIHRIFYRGDLPFCRYLPASDFRMHRSPALIPNVYIFRPDINRLEGKCRMQAHAKLILIVGIFCLFCGCVTTPPGDASGGQNGGISEITDQKADLQVSFGEAMADAALIDARGLSGSGGVPVYLVIGADVDASGDARSWMFGIRENGDPFILIYNADGWERVPWSGPLPEAPVDLDSVISPAELYRLQGDAIGQEMEDLNASVADLELADSIYSVKIRTATDISVLSFYSDTGGMVESV